MSVLPPGWRIQRNPDGSIGIFAPPPRLGESPRTSDVVYPEQNRDLHELLGKLADHQAAEPPGADPAALAYLGLCEAWLRTIAKTGDAPDNVREYALTRANALSAEGAARRRHASNYADLVAEMGQRIGALIETNRRLAEDSRSALAAIKALLAAENELDAAMADATAKAVVARLEGTT